LHFQDPIFLPRINAHRAFKHPNTAVTFAFGDAFRGRSVTDHHLIDWTIEEAKLLKGIRSQLSEVDPIPSLDQILTWPRNDFSPLPVEPTDSATTDGAIQEDSRTTPLVAPANSAEDAVRPQVASYPPIAVSVTDSISTNVQGEESPAFLSDAVGKSDAAAIAVDSNRMISLRWVLRDIRSKRLKGSPINQEDLQNLIEMDLVQIRDGAPVLTTKGEGAVNATGFPN
jgi:hypothetical protein